VRGEHRSIEHKMWCEREQRVVLVAHRLALATVDDDDRPATPGRHRAKLSGGGETGAAPATQTGPLDGIDELGTTARARVGGERYWAIAGVVAGEVRGPPGLPPAGE
jgi:hypothetical protein